MIKHYLKIGLRHFGRNKLHSLINIGGLSAGITCCVLILLYVQHELSYDKFQKNANRIYRISSPEFASTAPALGPLLKKDIPEVENSARLLKFGGIIKSDHNFFDEEKLFFADADYLKMFSYDFIEGDKQSALDDPYTLIISESEKKKYFGPGSAFGKILYMQDTIPLKITGVFRDQPSTTHLKTEMVASMATRKAMGAKLDVWSIGIYYTYVLLNENANVENFREKLNAFVKKTINVLPNRQDYKLTAQNIRNIHLNSSKEREIEPASNNSTIYIFISIALFVLLIACINYINIATATAVNREKEIGLRKTIGANKKQLRTQFLAEAMTTSVLSLFLSLIIAALLLPSLNSLTDINLKITDLLNPLTLFSILGITLFVGLLAGLYPAIILSSFNPVINLSKRKYSGKTGLNFRHALVVLQFALFFILVIGAIVIYRQLDYMKQQSLGFDKEHVLVLPYKWDGKVQKQYEFLKQEFLRKPEIRSVTESGDIPGKMATTMSFSVEGMPEGKTEDMQTLYVDYDFISTYGMQITSGRDFSKQIAGDADGEAYIVNEKAAATFGWKNDEAIGKKMSVQADGKIVGVVKDFHFNSLQQAVTPLVISIRSNWSGYISLRVSIAGIDKTLGYIENVWKKNIPDRPFEHFFLEEEFNNLYLAEDRLSKLITIFTTLAFLIAGIGIAGLTIFTVKKRTKEIGVRKVLGASVSKIVFLFSKEFIKPVLISMLIAFPVALFLMKAWLQNFAYRTNIAWWIFFAAGLLAILVALIIVGFHAIKAAIANPVKSLRTE